MKKWVLIKSNNLSEIFGSGSFNYENFGISNDELRKLSNLYFQPMIETENGAVMLSIFPITNENLFFGYMSPFIQANPDIIQIAGEEDALALHSVYLLDHNKQIADDLSTPTELDVYRSQQLLLLTEIKLLLQGEMNNGENN